MSFLQKSLIKRLRLSGSLSTRTLAVPAQDMLMASSLLPQVREVYKQLGGVQDDPQIKFRKWDIEYEGKAIELDEYVNFNRYRAQTLQSPLYGQLPLFPSKIYAGFCADHEDHCMKVARTGDKWSTEPAEQYFGSPAESGDLESEQGSPRWKQRAFYDFVQDLCPMLCNIQVVRLAIWDTVLEDGNPRTLLDALKTPTGASAGAIAKLISARSHSAS